MVIRLTALEELLASAAAESVIWPVIESLMALRGRRYCIGGNRRSATLCQRTTVDGLPWHGTDRLFRWPQHQARGAITKTGNN